MLRKFLLLFLLAFAAPAFAYDEPLADAAQEARARQLFTELRCVVCKGESVAESPADVARDIRTTVRERVAQGESDKAVLDYLVSRYGEFVLMKPVFEPETWILWFTPVIFLCLGIAIIVAYFSAGNLQSSKKKRKQP